MLRPWLMVLILGLGSFAFPTATANEWSSTRDYVEPTLGYDLGGLDCETGAGGACFPLQGTERSVVLTVLDDALGEVAFQVEFTDASGRFVGADFWCPSPRDAAAATYGEVFDGRWDEAAFYGVPERAVLMTVRIPGPLATNTQCHGIDSPTRGTITAAFSDAEWTREIPLAQSQHYQPTFSGGGACARWPFLVFDNLPYVCAGPFGSTAWFAVPDGSTAVDVALDDLQGVPVRASWTWWVTDENGWIEPLVWGSFCSSTRLDAPQGASSEMWLQIHPDYVPDIPPLSTLECAEAKAGRIDVAFHI